MNIEDHQKIISECHARHDAEVARLRKQVEMLRDALKKERNLRVLGRSPNISWESTREIRRNVYQQTDEALDATEQKP